VSGVDVPNPGAETVPDGLTGSTAGVESPETAQGKSAGSVRLVYELATLLEPEAANWATEADPVWREVTRSVAMAHAMTAISSGYRRVVEDDDTIERLARAIHDAECGTDDLCKGYDAHGEWDRKLRDDAYESVARAVVRALREDT
jgi:hypothetical protein